MKVVENPFVVVMFGNPATGKTYTSRALQEHCSNFNRTALLSTFSIREELGLVNLYSSSERETIYAEIINRANSVMRVGTSNVILDGNFNKSSRRKAIYDIATKYGYQIFVIHCDVTNNTVIEQRLEQRKKMPKSLEHASSTIDLYNLIKDTSEPLEVDLKNGAVINIVKVNSELQSVVVDHVSEPHTSHNLETILNGVKYGFGKVTK